MGNSYAIKCVVYIHNVHKMHLWHSITLAITTYVSEQIKEMLYLQISLTYSIL